MADNMVVLPGERCRKAREALGWSTAEAAKRMHLSQTYLVALEADDYERLPEATFVKGYLKNYAKLLGLPGDEIANTFQQMVRDDAFDKPLSLPEVAPAPGVLRKPVVWVVLAALLVLLLWWLWPSSSDTGAQPVGDMSSDMATGDDVDMLADSEPDVIEPQVSPVTESGDAVESEEAVDEAVESAPAEAAEDEAMAPDVPLADAQSEPAAEMLAANGLDRLVMRFSRDCWVRVVDGRGRTLKEGLQSAGAQLALDGKQPFTVRLGDAGAPEAMFLNGETVSAPTQRSGRPVTFTLP